MLIASMELQNFSEASDFCFITFKELPAPLNDTAVTELLLTEFDINYIIKVDPCFKHRFKLRFTAYETSEITQQLTDVTELFFII